MFSVEECIFLTKAFVKNQEVEVNEKQILGKRVFL